MKTMSDWLSRAARGIDDPSGVESPPCSRGMISSRRPVAPQSALLCANAGPQAIDPVTRVSSRVDLFEGEFNGTGVGLPYIEHQYPHRMLKAESSRSRRDRPLTRR